MRRAVLVALLAATLAAGAAPQPAAAGDGGPVRFTVAASGDLLIHSPIYQRARALGGGRRYDFRPFFRFLAPHLRAADLALCHVETPMAPGGPSGYPRFNTPRALATAIADAGWDACSTASNHALDQGVRGIRGTRDALSDAGIRHTGMFLTAGQRAATTMLDAGGTRIAFLSYSEMTNGIPLPRPWSVNLARAGRILEDARIARRRGADAVIVNLHWGAEFRHAPSAFQRTLARRLAESGLVTAIVGQHAHVVQPITFIDGVPVVYGEGNLLSNQSSACCPAAAQDGLVAVLDLVASTGGVTAERVRYLPTWVRRSDYAVLPVPEAIRRGLAPRATLRTSYRRTVRIAGRSNRVRPASSVVP